MNNLRRWALAFLCLGAVVRLAAPFISDIGDDGSNYVAMGKSLYAHGSFTMPWGQWQGPDAAYAPGASHHFSPLYPAFLAATYSVLGYSLAATRAAAVVMSFVFLGTAYFCAKNLWGRDAALVSTAIFSVEPDFVLPAMNGFTECLGAALFAATLWALLRAVKDPRFVVLAGGFAGLGYLTRGGMSAFFVVAGLGGVGWRVAHGGFRALLNKYYAAAVALFASCFALWAWRNVHDFGWPNWQTSSFITFAQSYALAHPARFSEALLFKSALFASFAWVYVVPLAPELWRCLKDWRAQAASLLLLASMLVLMVGVGMAAMFWVYENSPPFWRDNKRYAVAAFVPLVWAACSKADFSSRLFADRWGVLVGFLAVCTAFMVMTPMFATIAQSGSWLDDQLAAGDEIGVIRPIEPYSWFAYMRHPENVSVYVCQPAARDACPGHAPTYVLSHNGSMELPGYGLWHTTSVKRIIGSTEVYVYKLRDKVQVGA